VDDDAEDPDRRLRPRPLPSRSRSRSPCPDSLDPRGVSIELERSPGRCRRLGGTSMESASSGTPSAAAEAVVVVRNVGTSGAATATILQRPLSSPASEYIRPLPVLTPRRPRSAGADLNFHENPLYQSPSPIYQNPSPVYQCPSPVYQNPSPLYQNPSPVYQSPSPVAVHGRGTCGVTGDQCVYIRQPSIARLSSPVVSATTSRGSFAQGSSVTLQFNASPLSHHHPRCNAVQPYSCSHSNQALKMHYEDDSALCRHVSESHLHSTSCRCLAVVLRRMDDCHTTRVPRSECRCCSDQQHVAVLRRSSGASCDVKHNKRGFYQAVCTQSDDDDDVSPSLAISSRTEAEQEKNHHQDGHSASSAAPSCAHCSNCPCKGDYKPLCAVHGRRPVVRDFDDAELCFEKKSFHVDSAGCLSEEKQCRDGLPASLAPLGSDNPTRATASAPPIEPEFQEAVTELTSCTAFRQV
jgi:hypothetical protein